MRMPSGCAVKQYKTGFFRYVEDQRDNSNMIAEARNITNFKYFDQVFYELEKS